MKELSHPLRWLQKDTRNEAASGRQKAVSIQKSFVARFAFIAFLSLLSVSCDQQKEPTPQAATPVNNSPRLNSYQRFIPSTRQPENVTGVPWSGAFALDTKTGQLCLTYEGNFREP